MGKFRIYTQILQGNALFSGKNYTVGNIFTRPPVVTVATNFKSVMTMTLTIMLTMMIMLGVFTFDASLFSEDAEIKTSLTDRLTHSLTRSPIELPYTSQKSYFFRAIVWKKIKVEKQTQILKQIQVCWVYLSSDCYHSIAHSWQKLAPAWTRLAMSTTAIKRIFMLREYILKNMMNIVDVYSAWLLELGKDVLPTQ